MSNTNNNLQTQTSNALHNAIMEGGGKDRPPMLAPDNYNRPYKFKWAERIIPTTEGIDNDIYSTVDACPNACETWKAIERLKQCESINVQDLETNIYWKFRKFTSRDGETLESYYSRFVTLVKQSQELKTVSYHKLNDILKQHQNKVKEIRAERLSRTGKAIVNSPQPTYDQEPAMVAEDDSLSKEKEIDKLVALISLSFKKIYKPTNNNPITSSNTSRANHDNTPRINRGTGYDNQRTINVAGARENRARECQKPKRAKDAAYHKEKMLLCKQEESGFQLNAKQADWREHPKQPESVNETYPDEQGDTNITTDSLDMSNNGGEDDQDDDDLAKESDLLASLIEKLKCEIDESKDHNKLLESSNKTLVNKLKSEIEDFKNKNKCLESSNNHFKKANTKLAKNNQLMFKDLKNFRAELDRYHDVNYASKVEIDCAKARGELISYKMSSEKSFNKYTRKINNLNQTIS
ncbi:hypothetical protein Tco_0096747 [Tanacetum coccineum]